MKLSVVIVNYNVKFYLEQCLHSVEKALGDIEGEIIVVDNDSRDGSVPYLKEHFPRVRFIESKTNLGFAKANNLAIEQCRGEYVLLLNPDTIVTEHTFSDFIEFMDTRPDVGGCGAYMLRTEGSFALESRRGLPTPFVAFCKMSGLASLFPKSPLFGRYYMRYLDEELPAPIEIMSGAYMFLRRKALDKAGLLDEKFFMYGEDIDLSYRILKSGYKNYFLPSYILHYKGESTEKSSYRYVHTFYRAMQLFFNKHYAHYSLLLSLPINMAIWTRAILAYAGNQFKHNKTYKHPSTINCIAIGSIDALNEIHSLLDKYHGKGHHSFVEGNEETLPDGHLATDIDIAQFDTVVYDTDSYTYSTILRLLKNTPKNKLRIATYSAKTKKIITEEKIYKYR